MEIMEFIRFQSEIQMIAMCKDSTFEILSNHFENREKFEEFYNHISDKFKSKFINCGNYYNFLKNHVENANIQLIMIFSIVETIYSEEEYIDFKTWCDKKRSEIKLESFESFDVLLDHLKSKYHEVHGSKQKTLGFFDGYFDNADKKRLLDGLRYNINMKSLDGEEVDFNKFVSTIYTMRNNFIHSSRFVPIHKEGNISGPILIKNNETIVGFDMSMDIFLEMFEKAFINYFKSTVVSR